MPLTNPVHVFGLVMLVILIAPHLLARWRIPGLVVLILAGVLLGPHALGILERGQTMQLLGMVGLLYIMFVAGLLFDLDEFDRHRHRSFVFGIIGFALPQLFGTVVGRFLLDFDWLAAILLGSVFASHTLLAYPIVSKLGIARTEVVTTAVGATMLTDTAALLVLALVAGAAEGGLTPEFLITLIALLSLMVVAAVQGLPRLGRWFFRHASGDGISEYVFVLAVVFVCAAVAEWIGLEAIIGAFLAGLGLNRLVPDHGPLMNRIRFAGDALFIPFFLLATGMLVDPNVFVSQPSAIIVAVIMVATVVVTKGLAAWTTGALFRYNGAERFVLFSLSIPQAAATLAAVLVGFEIGFFGTDIINGTIAMMLVTCLMGPWLADRYGRTVAAREAAAVPEHRRDVRRILVPIANPASTNSLLELAGLIQASDAREPIYAVTIARDGPRVAEHVRHGEELLAEAVKYASEADLNVHGLTRVEFNAARGIRRVVHETRCGVVLMGWEETAGAERFIFGGISDQLLLEPDLMVILCRLDRPASLTQRLVLCLPPLSARHPGFAEALDVVGQVARRARLTLLVFGESVDWSEAAAGRLRPGDTQGCLDAWEDLESSLAQAVRPDDMLVLMSARSGELPWTAALDRLPQQLARRFAASDICVFYPAGAASADAIQFAEV